MSCTISKMVVGLGVYTIEGWYLIRNDGKSQVSQELWKPIQSKMALMLSGGTQSFFDIHFSGFFCSHSCVSPHKMAAVVALQRGAFCRAGWLPALQSARHGSKAVTRHRKAMHFERQKLMALTKYVPSKPAVPEKCIVPKRKPSEEEDNLLAKILCRRLEEVFRVNKMVAVFQSSSVAAEDLLLLRHRLLKHNIHIKFFPNEILRRTLSGSKYQNLLPLFIGHNILVVSQEVKAKEMLNVARNTPQVHLLGACIENTLLSKQGVINCSRLPSMALLHGEVVSGLTLMTSQTSALLQRNPMHLVCLLQQYVRQQSGPGVGATGEGQVEPPPAQGMA